MPPRARRPPRTARTPRRAALPLRIDNDREATYGTRPVHRGTRPGRTPSKRCWFPPGERRRIRRRCAPGRSGARGFRAPSRRPRPTPCSWTASAASSRRATSCWGPWRARCGRRHPQARRLPDHQRRDVPPAPTSAGSTARSSSRSAAPSTTATATCSPRASSAKTSTLTRAPSREDEQDRQGPRRRCSGSTRRSAARRLDRRHDLRLHKAPGHAGRSPTSSPSATSPASSFEPSHHARLPLRWPRVAAARRGERRQRGRLGPRELLRRDLSGRTARSRASAASTAPTSPAAPTRRSPPRTARTSCSRST